MKVAMRLNLTALPVIVGLVLLVLLAYFGEYQRQAPELLVILTGVAAVCSALLSWQNTRIVSRRVGELVRGFRELGLVASPSVSPSLDEFDELDAVRQSVMQLAADRSTWRKAAEEQVRVAEQRLRSHEHLLLEASRVARVRLEEIRLALHILQSSPFGELNENQEELIAAARSAADEADGELQTLGRLASAGDLAAQRAPEAITVRSLLESPLAMALSSTPDAVGNATGALPDDLPPVQVDAPAVQEALATLLRDAVSALSPGDRLRLDAQVAEVRVVLTIQPAPAWSEIPGLRAQLAIRLLEAQGGAVHREQHALHVALPRAPRMRVDVPLP